MSLAQKIVQEFLSSSAVFSSFALSLLLIGLEQLIELELLCPCRVELNQRLIVFIFIGPFIFTFALMFILLRPFRYRCCERSADKAKDDQQNCSTDLCLRLRPSGKKSCKKANKSEDLSSEKTCTTALAHCLIPPVMWIIILLLDGDYLACRWTTWEGKYVFNKDMNRMWCQPTELSYAGNISDLHNEYQMFISTSQFCGYVVLFVIGAVTFVVMGIYDCCRKRVGSKKAECATQTEVQCATQTEEEEGAQNVELKPLMRSSLKGPITWTKDTVIL